MEEKDIQLITDKIGNHLNDGADLLDAEMLYDYPVYTINKERIFDLIEYLYVELGFSYLTDITGIHYPDKKGQELGVIYHLHNLPNNWRVRIKAFMTENHPEVTSITPIFLGANWMERETYDFFGIKFKGHPNMTRILNIDTMVGWPMRKEYPLEDQEREDKDDKMFGRE